MRVLCSVPGCNRSREVKSELDEWLCGEHWRLVPKKMRRVLSRYIRRARRGDYHRTNAEAWRRCWLRAKREAIEIAMGITA
jgi:hypothetical protein